jgi:hypothetical protein
VINPDDKRLSYVPLEQLTAPRTGYTAFVENWWVVHPDRGAAIWRGHAPQCNSDRRVTERLSGRLYPWANVQLVPVAYLHVRPSGELAL